MLYTEKVLQIQHFNITAILTSDTRKYKYVFFHFLERLIKLYITTMKQTYIFAYRNFLFEKLSRNNIIIFHAAEDNVERFCIIAELEF